MVESTAEAPSAQQTADGDVVRDKVVVVTGGGNGIGRAIATRLAAGGARLAIADRDEAAARSVADDLSALAVPGDVASTDGVESLVARVRAELGPIDVYFANAGVDVGAGLDTPESEWRQALEVNVMGHIRAARALVPQWLEAGGGRFVVTASAAGLLTMLGSATYSVSKHAAVAFAEWLAITYGHRGVVVQALCPQGVRTNMLANSRFEELLSHDQALEPTEVADTVWAALHDDRFLILPHPEVHDYYQLRASQTDRWLAGMRKLQQRYDDA